MPPETSIMETPVRTLTEGYWVETIEDSLSHYIPREIDRHIDETVYRDIWERLRIREGLSEQSNRSSKKWSNNVRLYTLLRMLGHRDGDEVFQKFESETIGDFWLPLTPSILRHLSSVPGFRPSDFIAKQRYVMSDSRQMNERNLIVPFFRQAYGPGPRVRSPGAPTHRYLEIARSHFEDLERIAVGGSAYVLRVQHITSGKEFACKRLPRTTSIRGQREQLNVFKNEVSVLQGFRHHHIVRLVTSFTDLESFSIILHPIADRQLLEVLKHEQPLSNRMVEILSYSFNCLATALAYLHENSVRHKDIKPSNILLSEGRVLLCDFGISLEWSESDNGTTEGASRSFTRRYAAPEVFRFGTPRNLKTDVWSLGCVFLEILSAIKGYSFDEVDVGECTEGLSLEAIKDWLEKLRANNEDTTFDLPIDWTLAMIMEDPRERLDASDIVSRIHEDTRTLGVTSRFLASCCSESGYDSPSNTSISSARTSNPSADFYAHDNFTLPLGDVSSTQAYRHPPSSSQRSGSFPILARNSSSGSASMRPSAFRTRQGRGDAITAQDIAAFPSVRTSTATSEILSRSNSSCFESPEALRCVSQESSDVIVHNTLGASASLVNLSRFCHVREDERHLFRAPITSFIIKESATVEESSTCCKKSESTVQVFETVHASMDGRRSSTSSVWMATRRVVLSEAIAPNTTRCYSFWLPLAYICFSLRGVEVILQWSDCNQPQQGSTQDHREYWSWVYDPRRTNNEVKIKFDDLDTAKKFLSIVRFSMEGGSTIDISDSQEVRIWASTRSGRREGIVSLTHDEGPFSDSSLFVIGRYIDPRIERLLPSCCLNVQLNNISKPNYLSDLREEPIRGRNRVAWFHTVELIPASFSVSALPAADRESPTPPPAIVAMFQKLTGWKLEYFAAVEQVSSKRHALQIIKERYGAADVMIWKKQSQNIVSVGVTFRLSEGNVWMSGRITKSTCVSSIYEDATCWFDMFGKRRGHLLDTSTMTAVTDRDLNDPSSVNLYSGSQHESKRFILQIQNYKHRQKLAELIEELIRTIAMNPPASNANRTPVARKRYNPPTPMA